MDVKEFAFHHVISKLDGQRVDITNLRNQASISAAVSGIIASVFASLISDFELIHLLSGSFYLGLSSFGFLALGAFASSIAFSVLVVVSWRDFTFSFSSSRMLEVYEEDRELDVFLKRYIKDGEWFFEDNEKHIKSAQQFLWWAMVLAFVQIIPWTILILGA